MILEKAFTDANYERSNKGMSYIEKNLIDSDRNMYLAVDSLIEINNIILFQIILLGEMLM